MPSRRALLYTPGDEKGLTISCNGVQSNQPPGDSISGPTPTERWVVS
ncbi:MAG: hypothetical protein QMD04_00640 [Anaerolineales bacterium]|nr:hypothetical protein [Anaerolineales bacterium]